MKNRQALVLLEQLVMILVLSLASVLCLQAIVWADQTARELQQHSQAVLLCQNGVETLKAAGDLEKGAALLGAVRQGDRWTADREEDLRLELEPMLPSQPGMGQAVIRVVSRETEKQHFSLIAGWQEELP